MNADELAAQPRTKRLRQVILELSLISHVKATSYDSSGGGGGPSDKSGARPPGGPDFLGDREPEFRQRSHLYFLRKYGNLVKGLDRLSDDRVTEIRDQILVEAITCLRDWRRTPRPKGKDPDPGSRAWKILVGNSPKSSRVLASLYGISHSTVLRIREQYKGVTE